MARRKGMTYENTLFNYFTEHGHTIHKRNRSGYDGEDHTIIAGTLSFASEAKNQAKMVLSQWVDQAETQTLNPDHLPIVIHKRRLRSDPDDHYVTMTTRTFRRILDHLKESDPIAKEPSDPRR